MTSRPCFTDFKHIIARHDFVEGGALPAALQLWAGTSGAHNVFYAPFEHRNRAPKIALIGITPGRTQAIRALQAAKRAMEMGLPDERCLIAAKLYASFGGVMRDDLVAMLDLLGVNTHIGEPTTRRLWTPEGYASAHFCSLLSFPTFNDEEDYNNSPSLTDCEAFRSMLEETAETLNALPTETLILPLGAQATTALVKLRKERILTRDLPSVEDEPIYVPHPSGQNAESIKLVLDWQYDDANEYATARYKQYLVEQPWKRKRGRRQQSEEDYKKRRVSRWKAVHRVRTYFDIT